MTTVANNWRRMLRHYLRELTADPQWRRVVADATLVVHGSVTTGDADRWSDIDIQVVCPEQEYVAARRRAVVDGLLDESERPVVFRSRERTADGRRTLFAAELRSLADIATALDEDLVLELWVLEHAWVVRDPSERMTSLVADGRQRFLDRLEVLAAEELGHAARRQRWLAVAAQRGDTAGTALLAAGFARSVLRLACLLDSSPAPPDKWAHAWASTNTALGAVAGEACGRLLTGGLPGRAVDALSAEVVESARVLAAARWPGAPWVAAPTRYGPIRC